jgi:eukaryotic-like serine/threonine-protein kinase
MGERQPTGHEKTMLASQERARDIRTPVPARICPTCGGEYPLDFAVCPKDATPLGAAQAGEDPFIGIVLGGTYRITGVVAEGGMGRLYEAVHTRLDRRLAVKVLHEMYAKSAEGVARFEREAKTTARIRSDYLVDVVDVLRTPDGRPCIISELLDGEDLQQILDVKGTLSLAEAIPIARQICRALADAHAHDVVHRDLKPSNVFLTRAPGGERRVKILDFGVAKTLAAEELTQTGAILGTPQYMAPEQAKGSASVDRRADVYAAGACLYRMLTGQSPYGNDTNPLAKLLHEEPLRPRAIEKGIPEGIEAVIQHAMARDPENRPATALELEQELEAFDDPTARPRDAATGLTISVAGPPRSHERTLSVRGGPPSVADQITRRARLARPSAMALAASAALVAGLAVAAVLGSVVRNVSRAGRLTRTEWFLVFLLSSAVALGTTILLVRALVSRWRSAPSVGQLTGRVSRSLGVGLFTLGALELASHGLASVLDMPKWTSPTLTTIWISAATLLAGISAWRHRR